MNESIHIALASNSVFVPGLLVTAGTMLNACSKQQRLCFHILYDGLTEGDKEQIRRLVENRAEVVYHEMTPWAERLSHKLKPWHGSYTAYFRLFLPDILKDCEWVIYADSDTIWFRDVAELWGLRDSHYSIQWCLDIPWRREVAADQLHTIAPGLDCTRYCNSGVVLLNLKKCRENDAVGRCLDLVEHADSTECLFDQDILNIVFQHEMSILPPEWNIVWGVDNIRSGAVFHITDVIRCFNRLPVTDRPQYEIWSRLYHKLCLWIAPQVRFSLYSFVYRIGGLLYFLHGLTKCMKAGEMRRTIERTWYYAWVLDSGIWNKYRRS